MTNFAAAFLLVAAAFATAEAHESALAAVSDDNMRPQTEAASSTLQTWPLPHLISLRKEAIPVRRKGKVVSYKSSYSGAITLGSPTPQEFRVVFDTGSGHVIVPALQCNAEPCLKHRRYNASASATSRPMNADGSPLDDSGIGDTATIGFGTGKVTGEIVSEQVCLGPPPDETAASGGSDVGGDDSRGRNLRRAPGSPPMPQRNAQWTSLTPAPAVSAAATVPCTEVQMVAATDMTQNPFSFFSFDGVVGLGLGALSLSANFSLFGKMVHSGQLALPHFGFFVGGMREEGAGTTEAAGELAVGGHNAARRAGPLAWTPVARPELGFWQVEILALYVAGEKLDVCAEGGCYGVVDTGTSHVGIPKAHNSLVESLLSREPGDVKDCRYVEAPLLQIGLRNMNLTLGPESYMRQLPLPEGTRMGSGVNVGKEAAQSAAPADRDAGGPAAGDVEVKTWCRPKLTSVSMPAPLGPNLFILGEPVLHSFYTVFDWSESAPRIGFSPAARNQDNNVVSV